MIQLQQNEYVNKVRFVRVQTVKARVVYAMRGIVAANIRVASAFGFALGLGIAGLGAANAAAPAAPTAKPDLQKGQAIVEAQCAACHGADGNSAAPVNPKLAQQHPEYLMKQLHNFKPQVDAQNKPKKAERENAVMAGFAAMLSDEDIRNVSAYFASKPIKPGVAKNKELLALGEKIYRGGVADKKIPACAGCHSPNGAGIPAQYPRLGGQHAQYTEAQLVAFRDGVRNNNAQMTAIAYKMSDREMKAVADYIAGLR